VGADGGFTLPEEIDRVVQDLVKETSPIRSIANVVTVGTSDYKKLVNLHGTASGWVGEPAERPETSSPQFAEIAPPMGEVYANPAATQIMLDDSFVDVEAWLAVEIALEFAKAEGAAFISGNGTNRPRGFLAGSAPVATADGTRAFGVLQYVPSGLAAAMPTDSNVYINLTMSLKAAHRQNANWVSNKAALSEVRKLKTTDGQYLWAPGLVSGQPDSLLGYTIVEAEDMPAIAANAFPLAFGNFRAGYTIVDRPTGVSMRDPYTNKPYVMFYTTKRVGGAVIDSEAIKVLKIATS
jgi:HK97 family phage major capsid protein